MQITVQRIRRAYWQARFKVHSRHVGEGRTKAEAIGHLMILASDSDDVHAGPKVTELPPGEFANLPVGR